MVCTQKGFCSLIFIALVYLYYLLGPSALLAINPATGPEKAVKSKVSEFIEATDDLAEEQVIEVSAKRKSSSLSRVKRRAIESLEQLADDLLIESQLINQALHAILKAGHEVIAGEHQGAFMTVLREQKQDLVDALERANSISLGRQKELADLIKVVTPVKEKTVCSKK